MASLKEFKQDIPLVGLEGNLNGPLVAFGVECVGRHYYK
jgi:hypothetical protein